jgi:radical SAM superfamily enzyme YgiQ (UPF0313 family)
VSRILLIEAPSSDFAWNQVASPPLGLLYIASALIEGTFFDTSDISVSVIPMQLLAYVNVTFDLVKAIEDHNPEIVAISSMTPNFGEAQKIATLVKGLDDRIITIYGGVHATLNHKKVASENCFDIVVRGEGEVTFCECVFKILKHGGMEGINKIKGITYKDVKGNIKINPERELIENINILPLPARNLIEMDEYIKLNEYRAGGLLFSRGCPYSCSFCYSEALWKGFHRIRSVDNVVEEIKVLYRDFGIRKIRFEDDTFTHNRHLIIALCEKLVGENIKIEWLMKTRADLLDRELIGIMKSAGLKSILFGVESISATSLQGINKEQDVTLYENALQLCHEFSIQAIMTIIIGLAQDTKADMVNTINWVKNNIGDKDIVIRCMYTPYRELLEGIESGVIIVSDNLEHYTMDFPLTYSMNHSYEELVEVQREADCLMKEYGLNRGLRKYD